MPPPAARPLLPVEEREVVRVHLGDQERHVVLHPERLRVRDDELPARGLERLDRVGDRRVEAPRGRSATRAASSTAFTTRPRASSGHVAREEPARRLEVASSPPSAPRPRPRRGRSVGWPARSDTIRCPTAPVAPRIATGIRPSRSSVFIWPSVLFPGSPAGNRKARRYRRALRLLRFRTTVSYTIVRSPAGPPRGVRCVVVFDRFRGAARLIGAGGYGVGLGLSSGPQSPRPPVFTAPALPTGRAAGPPARPPRRRPPG